MSGNWSSPIMRGVGSDGAFDMGRFSQARAESIFPLWLLQHLPNMAAAHISILHHAMGPNSTIVTACAAGTQAVGDAFRLIARGDADVMLAGGCDSRLDPQLFVAYSAMKAVSASLRPPTEVSRPFDAERDGFVLGEGAALLVLESYRRARRRGATIYAEITGYGSSFDAFGITRPEPEGKGAALSMIGGPARSAHRPVRGRLHQRPRHQHQAQRPDGDGRGQARVRPQGGLDTDE